MRQLTIFTVITTLMLSPAVLAEEEMETMEMEMMETETDGTETMTTLHEFDGLSPGEQMIARSLFDAQTLPEDGSVEPWTLDDITAARSETGWGNVFKQMQAEDLIDAKNLGQVVSAHVRSTHQPITDSIVSEAGMSTEMSVKEQNSDEAAMDSDEIAMTETETTDAPTDVDGAFENLSTGNKKIARSLFDAQVLPGDGSVEPLTLDQIAAAKSETGWGNVFKQMQYEGLVDAKNLGQVVSQYQHSTVTVSGDTTGISAAATASSSKHLPEHANGKASGHVDKGVVTAGVTTTPGSGNGNAYGLTKQAVSASDGITMADGAVVTASGNSNAAFAAANSNAANNGVSGPSHNIAGSSNTDKGYAYGRNK